MHVEPLEKLPRSVREFLSHYAMIVLSILTALALEQAALGLEHRHEGRRAKDEIEQEIAANRQAIDEALVITRANARTWESLVARTVAEVKSGAATDDSLVAKMAEAGRNFRDALPPLKSTAWDSALSDHAVNYLEHEDLTHYSEVYASQKLFSQAMWDMIRDSATRDLPAISLTLALGKADPTATVSTLDARLRTIEIVESQLLQLQDVLKGTPGATLRAQDEAERGAASAASAAGPAASR